MLRLGTDTRAGVGLDLSQVARIAAVLALCATPTVAYAGKGDRGVVFPGGIGDDGAGGGAIGANVGEGVPELADLGGGVGLASGPSSALMAVGGYVDSAIVQSRFRFRFDAGYDNPVPDRAEFFYGEDGPGGLAAEPRVDHQELSMYLEHLIAERWSLFVEMPFRLLNPEVNPNTAGLSDVNAGFRYAIWDCPDEFLTLQFRVYAPSGDADRGLGTGHASLEPGLLYQGRYTDRLSILGEFKGWFPLGDSVDDDRPMAGEVLRYGLGAAYDLRGYSDNLTAVTEVVG